MSQSRLFICEHPLRNSQLLLGRNISTRDRTVANIVDGRLASASDTVLVVDALNPVSGVDVFDQGNLEAGSSSLSGGDGRVSQEVFPNLGS